MATAGLEDDAVNGPELEGCWLVRLMEISVSAVQLIEHGHGGVRHNAVCEKEPG